MDSKTNRMHQNKCFPAILWTEKYDSPNWGKRKTQTEEFLSILLVKKTKHMYNRK